MTTTWLEPALIILIMTGIVLAIWKGGQANPEGTGTLGKRLGRLEGKVSSVASQVGTIEKQVEDIERRSAKASDIERLERQLAEQSKRMAEAAIQMGKLAEVQAATKEAGDQRGKQLDRLYDFIVQRGMSK